MSLGTGTFGGGGEFFKAWGASDVAEATRLVDICLEAGLTMFDSADVYSNGMAEEILGQAIKGRRDQVIISTKGTFRSGPGPNDVGSSRYHLIRAVEASLRRLGTDYIDLYQLHGFDALTPVEEVLGTLDDLVRGRQDPLHRLLELLRLAPDEVAGRLGEVRPGPLRRPPGLLLADRPRLRMGADAAGARPEGRRGRLEPAGLGPAHRQDPPRPAAARRPAASRASSSTDIGPPVADEYVYRVVDALDEVAKETGKTVPQIALNWLLQRPSVANVIIGARNEEQLRQNLGAVGWNLTPAQVAKLDAASADHAGLPVLAPAGLRRAEPVSHRLS